MIFTSNDQSKARTNTKRGGFIVIQAESSSLQPEDAELLSCILSAHPAKVLYWSAACALDAILLSRSNALRGKLPGYVYSRIMGQMPGSTSQHKHDGAPAYDRDLKVAVTQS